MFQSAFKHQVLKKGHSDVWYLKRPDMQLPVPPLPTIEIPAEVLPDLREVYGVDGEGTLYALGPDADLEMGERRIRRWGAVSYGESDESEADEAVLDHELGRPFYGSIALTPTGEVLAVSNLPSFVIFDATGARRLDRSRLLATPGLFEPPPGELPFWQSGAGDLAAGPDSVLVGGFPLGRIDQYSYDGRLLQSIRRFSHLGQAYDLREMHIAKVGFDGRGRILATGPQHLVVFTPDGEAETVIETAKIVIPGGSSDFHLWIGVDRQGLLWSQFYKGKEVAYGAFELPG